jgi:hypothetical protein
MEFDYKIYPDKNLVITKAVGDSALEDMIIHMNKVNADPAFKKGMNSIVDISEVAIKIDIQTMSRLLEYIKTIEKVRGKCKWAIVAPRDLYYGLVRMFSFLSRDTMIETQAFRTLEEALEWVGAEPDEK